MVFSSISALVGGLGGINQTQVRVILAFSSIGHIGWTLACVLISTPNTLIYLLIYVLNLIPLMFTLNYLNAISSSTSFLLSSAPPFLALTTLLLFFSLGGMPPLLGFIPKLIVLNILTSISQYYLAASLILGSLINLYYYLTFTLTFTFSPSSSPKISSCSPSLTFYTITFIPLMALPPALRLL